MLDGACRIPDMVDWAVENSVPAVALTDHGNMFGAYELYNRATAAGINPIIGCEVYVAHGVERRVVKNTKIHITSRCLQRMQPVIETS